MSNRRRNRKNGPAFWKLLSALVGITVLVWGYQEYSKNNGSQKTSTVVQNISSKNEQNEIKESVTPAANENSVAETTVAESQPVAMAETQQAESAPKTISQNVLSSRAWQDDYVKMEYPVKSKEGKKLMLVAYGLVPEGKNPDKIRNPDLLWPALAIAEKTSKGFEKVKELDLIKSSGDKSLRGIPRFKEEDLTDIDKDGFPELIVHLDSVGESNEKIGLLKWDGTNLQWMKKKVSDKEKTALWSTGTVGNDKKSIKLSKNKIVEKVTGFDAANPDKGFQTRTNEWKYEQGVWMR